MRMYLLLMQMLLMRGQGGPGCASQFGSLFEVQLLF